MNIAQILVIIAIVLCLLNSYFSSYVEITPPHEAVFEFYKKQEGAKFEEDVKAAERYLKTEMSKQIISLKRYETWSIRPHYTFTANKGDFHQLVLWKATERIFGKRLNHIVIEHSPLSNQPYHYTIYIMH